MKIKLIITLIVVTMIAQSTCFAAYQIADADNSVILSGETKSNGEVSILLLNSDNMGYDNAENTFNAYKDNIDKKKVMTTNEIFHYRNITANEDGKWEYIVPMGDIDKINLAFISNVGDIEYVEYASVTYRKSIIEELQKKMNIGIDEVSSEISSNIKYISTYPKLYNALDNKVMVANLSVDTINSISADNDGLKLLNNTLNKSIIIASVDEGRILDFETAMSVFAYDTEAANNTNSEGLNKIIELLKNGNYVSIDDYIKKAEFQIALQEINYNKNQAGEFLVSIIGENNNILGLDLTKFNGLSESDKAVAARSFANKKSSNKQEAQRNLDSIVDDIKESKRQPSSPGGSGNGGNGTGIYVGSANASISEQYAQENKYIYTDMNEADWACDAIVELAERNIVKGYNDGTFKPNKLITRAEFITLVVNTFFESSDHEYTNTFSDVNDKDWFSDVINTAWNEGIVSGNGNGEFMPDAPITRQDMSVIIYNAANKFNLLQTKENGREFVDDDEISEYARESVYSLKNNGIINGVGNDYFAPVENATRAAAAQIIYRLINKLN